MPDVTIPSGQQETIINEEMAGLTLDANSDVVGYIIDVGSNAIRIADERDQDMVRSGFPWDAGDTFTIDPRGNAIVAFGDGGGPSTVNVQRMTFEIMELG